MTCVMIFMKKYPFYSLGRSDIEDDNSGQGSKKDGRELDKSEDLHQGGERNRQNESRRPQYSRS